MNDKVTPTTDAPTTPATPPGIPLDKPIPRGDTIITHVQLRRPLAGELRGINLAALIREMDYAALEVLLPRVSTPTLTRADVAILDPADLAALAAEVILFFVPSAAMAEMALLSPNA